MADSAADEADAVRLGHLNEISWCRTAVGFSTKGTYRGEPGSMLCAGGSWLPPIGNVAFRTDDTLPADVLLARADAFFAEVGRGYNMMLRDTGQDDDLAAACESKGMKPFGEPSPQMVCHHRLDPPQVPDNVDLRAVSDVQGVADFVAINANAYATYGMPPDVLPDLFDRPEAVLAHKDTVVVVAYLEDRPVATALTYLSDGVGCLQWVGTVDDVRSLRLGRAVTQWATNAAFDRGAAACVLQASPMGEPLYAKLGYETLYRYKEYILWQAPVTPN
jgi:hypothetical protein